MVDVFSFYDTIVYGLLIERAAGRRDYVAAEE
jgi:hypothetical protein